MATNFEVKKLLRDMEDFWYDEREESTLDIYEPKINGTSDKLKI